MKNVLIISKYFAPENTIGAVRATKFAKYLALEHGCEVTVLTRTDDFDIRDPLLEADMKYCKRIIRVSPGKLTKALGRFYEFRVRGKKDENSVKSDNSMPSAVRSSDVGFFGKLMENLNFIQEWLKARDYAKQAFGAVKDDLDEFDAVFSTYSPMSEHIIAQRCKRARPQLVWVCDFRDQPYNKNKKLFCEKLQARVSSHSFIKQADAVTVVSEGITRDMGWDSLAKLGVVSNGFDQCDRDGISRKAREQFTLAYTGGFYTEKSSLEPALEAIRQLCDEGKADGSRIRLVYAGAQVGALEKQLTDAGLQIAVINHGIVDRRQSLELQSEADLLLLTCWNERGNRSGVLTGKFLEYMSAGVPILGVISGDLSNSLIKRHIDAGKLGYCYEQAGGTESFEGMKAFIKAQYDSWLETGKPLFSPDKKYVDGFSYPVLTDELWKIMNDAKDARKNG